MSTDYYLVCKNHGVGINLTDNKLNPPIDEELLKIFLWSHSGCGAILENEHTFDFQLERKFQAESISLNMDILKDIQSVHHGTQRIAFGSMVRWLARKIIMLGWWLAEIGSR